MAKNGYEKLKSGDDAKENVNPVLNANILSKITIWWMNKIFVTGNKRPLEEEDLFPLLEEDKSSVLTENLQREWQKELDKRHQGKRPRFWKALMRVCPWYEYLSIVALVLTDMANRMTLPVLLGFLISYLMGIRQLDVSFKYILPTFICITSLGRNIAQHHYQNRSALLGMRFRAAATGLLYRKVRNKFNFCFKGKGTLFIVGSSFSYETGINGSRRCALHLPTPFLRQCSILRVFKAIAL